MSLFFHMSCSLEFCSDVHRIILITTITVKMFLTFLCFHRMMGFWFNFSRGNKWVHLHQFALHITDSALKWSVNHTHLSNTLTANRTLESVPLLDSFYSSLNNGAPNNKSLMFPKCNLLTSLTCQKSSDLCVFCLSVLWMESCKKRSIRMWTSCQCLRSSIR